MVEKTINEDLQKERKTYTFNLEELTNFLDGGVEQTKKRRKLGKYYTYFMYLLHNTFVLVYVSIHVFIILFINK